MTSLCDIPLVFLRCHGYVSLHTTFLVANHVSLANKLRKRMDTIRVNTFMAFTIPFGVYHAAGYCSSYFYDAAP